MNEENTIIQQVYAAKTDNQEADRLIGAYMPFIKAETAKFLKRPPASQDDELSIAMIAFHEAIQGYSRMRGAFLKYASMLIRSRLIDYHRRERRHGSLISLDTPADEDDVPLGDTLTDTRDHGEEVSMRDARRITVPDSSARLRHAGKPSGTRYIPTDCWTNFSKADGFPSPGFPPEAAWRKKHWNGTENIWLPSC